METISKLQPSRTIHLQDFSDFGAAADLHSESETGFKVSGIFSDADDFALLVLRGRELPAGDFHLAEIKRGGEQRPGQGVDDVAGRKILAAGVAGHQAPPLPQVAVDDAFVVRRFQRLGNLLRDRQRFVQRDGPPLMRSASFEKISGRTLRATSRPRRGARAR